MPKRNWVVVGIDPGKIPTVCVAWDRGATVRFFEGVQTGEYAKTKPGDTVKALAGPAAEKIRDIIDHHNPHLIVLEKVWVRPEQGISSQAKLVYSMGVCYGIARALQLSTLFVFPQTWQRFWGLIGQDKKQHRVRACQLDPNVAEHLVRVKDHDRADAYLLAMFGMEYMDRAFESGCRRGYPLDHTPKFNVVR